MVHTTQRKLQLPLKMQQNAILDGMDEGIRRILGYTHGLKHTKPEYMLTVSVADKLRDLNVIPYEGLKIELEKPTDEILKAIVMDRKHHAQCLNLQGKKSTRKADSKIKSPYKKVVEDAMRWKKEISAKLRYGKVDIFASVDIMANSPAEHLIIIEVKREEPSLREMKKDIKRLEGFIICSLHSKSNVIGHLTFFTLTPKTDEEIKKTFCENLDKKISIEVESKRIEGETSQIDYIDDRGTPIHYIEGISHIYIHCISLKLKNSISET